ncbi:MAG TPA: RteC domain-containing protein [Flavobacteriaceae bacterium]|nr:RteC domain-containing protein [Flavobacteriaceae bacterium]
MKKFSKILEGFQNEIQRTMSENPGIVKQSNLGVVICNRYLAKLKNTLLEDPPKSTEEEIYFFKEIKPKVLGELLFFNHLRSIEMRISGKSNPFKKDLIQQELKLIDDFLCDHADFLLYLTFHHIHFDEHYFTRGKEVQYLPLNAAGFYYDLEFNTLYDRLMAQLFAKNKLSVYLKERFVNIDQEGNFLTFTGKRQKLKWTASKTALVELIYALYCSNSINNGHTGIKEIAATFETMFDIEIGEVYQFFSEIKMRRKSTTKFLDELSFALNSKITNAEL